ncbi:MAG: class I SAM-dependent methyltransferase [Burkholderiales bacterium]|jgi:SAM-dependent methyltransferase|nr:class I SAM-dependent methyltransferase [Burkholderiales bacterium]
MTPTTIAGDVDYASHGLGYGRQRRTDPRIEAWVHAALGDARTVLNVGAGAGSYEPLDRHVLAIEPAAAMRAQRPAHLTPAVDGVAERLPLDDQSFDAAMALVTVHQWPDVARGLAELRRVTRGPIVLLTFDGDALDRWWMADYAPEMLAVERRRFPRIASLVDGLGGACEVHAIPIPNDCVDGFSEAFYARPEAFLDPAVRRSQSAWSFVPDDAKARFVHRLGADLASGVWERRHGAWRAKPTFEGSLRGIVSRPPR